jgi:Spy/CpxP family protein refolding chaperone
MSTLAKASTVPTNGGRRGQRVRRGFFYAFLLIAGGILGVLIYEMASAWAQGGPPGASAGPSFAMHGDPGFGGGFLLPSRLEWMIDRALWSVDATSEQRKKITAIAERAADDVFALREEHLAGRKQIGEALAAPTIDHARVEALRLSQMKLADTASQRITAAVLEAAEVLTPGQRADLARRIEARRRWFRG